MNSSLLDIMEIDDSINPKFRDMRDECIKFIRGIPDEASNFLYFVLSKKKTRILIGLPTSPIHVYLASFAITGQYMKEQNSLLLYYVKGFENVFLRTFVHETGHVFFESNVGSITEFPRELWGLCKVIDESIANYLVLKFECDKEFEKHVRELVDFFAKHIVECEELYHMIHIFAPRIIPYALYQSKIATMEEFIEVAKKPIELIPLLQKVSDKKLRKSIAGVLYSAEIIDDEGLREFGFSTSDFRITGLREALAKIPEEKIDDITIGVLVAVACILKLASTREREFVMTRFNRFFEELKRVEFVHEHLTLFLRDPQAFLGAMNETTLGIAEIVDKLSEEDMIEIISTIFGI